MGIFSMVFGVVLFFGFTGGGYILAQNINAFLARMGEADLVGQTYASFFSLPPSVPVVPIVIVCAFVGLLLGLSFFMKGLTYQKIARIEQYLEEE